MEDVVCSDCCAEPAVPEQTQAQMEAEGWDFRGEFGPRCPECVGLNTVPEGEAGLDAIADALGATKAEPKVIGIEFSAQVIDTAGFGGCVDYDPDYKGPFPPVVEQPKPNAMVLIPNKKETP